MKSLGQTMLDSEDQFEDKVIDYAIEWKQLVTLKFTSELKMVVESRREMERYTKKVESLRASHDRHWNKDVPTKLVEKLERNEDKLRVASRTFEKHERNLILLVDSLIDQSWKDLYPLILQLFSFDVQCAQDRALVMTELNNVVCDLNFLGHEQGLDSEGRSATDLWRSLRSEAPKEAPEEKAPEVKKESEMISVVGASWAEAASFEEAWSGTMVSS